MSTSLTPPRISPLRWVLLALLATLAAVACIGPLVSGIRAQSWVKTKATMLRCDFAQDTDSLEDLAVTYQYSVDGQTYTGNRFGFMDGRSGREWAAAYKSGLEVTCFVNPKDPTDALLQRDMAVTYWLLPGIFGLIAVCLAYGAKRAFVQQRIADAATLYTLETAVTDNRTRIRRAA
jgi:hypothetical protein